MLGQRRRRWHNIETTLVERFVFAGKRGLVSTRRILLLLPYIDNQ